jgi:hypothetical protein
MSYDLETRSDAKYQQLIPREKAHAVVARIAGVQPNGDASFTIEREKEFYLEVDVEYVNEEGDNLEEQEISEKINCIRFHIPAAFQEVLNEEIKVAQEIADGVGWPLIDLQTGEPAAPVPELPAPKKSRWQFWK